MGRPIDMPTDVQARVEERARLVGGEILRRAGRAKPPGGAALRRLMADERLRVQALRFVDVLPALAGDDAALVRHLDEYFTDHDDLLRAVPVAGRLPSLTDWALQHASHGIAAHLVAPVVRAAAARMARNFIAGHSVHTALPTLARLHRRGMGFTLDLLGEATLSEAEADDYQRRYLALLRDLAPRVQAWSGDEALETISGRPSPRLNLSVKVSALCSQFRPQHPDHTVAIIKRRLRPILLAAREQGAFVNLDMEQYDTKAITLQAFCELLIEDALRDWPDAGIALQAYLRDTADDVDSLAEWAQRRGTPVTVRLVRGAYWDYETVVAQQHGWQPPVWTVKADTDASYERCLWKLLHAYPHLEAAVATHNVRSIALTLALAEQLALDRTQYEFQMLFGMADVLKESLTGLGQRLRVYVPFGELLPGMAYLVRRLLENTSSQSFLRMSFTEHVDPDTLLAPPKPTDEPSAANPWDPPEGDPPEGGPPKAAPPHPPPYFPEPVRRFTDVAERDAFAAAIEQVRATPAQTIPLVIAGERRMEGDMVDSVNPAYPAHVVGRSRWATPAEAAEAIAAAVRAQPAWRDRPWAERAACLRRAAAAMRDRRDELAAVEVFEAGKPWADADADVCEAIDFLEYYAREALRLGEGVWLNAAGETNHYLYEPRGVGAIITPWNFPLAIVTGMTSAALVTGNAVVLKPAPQTPVIAARLVEIMHSDAVGLPPGVLNFLPGPDEVGAALVTDKRTHFVAFTGSQVVGTWINATGAKVPDGQHHIKRIVAEMGGKNAIVVDDDADPDDAVIGIVASAFGYAGQKCSACSRAIIVGDQHDALVQRLVEATRSLVVGPPDEPTNLVPPVIDAEAQQRIENAIARARREATCVLGSDAATRRGEATRDAGSPVEAEGYYVAPTIFTGVAADSELAQNEIFGPVLAVLRADSFEHALDIANGTRYALTGGVYSRSPAHLRLARQRFAVGNLYLNRPITGSIVGRQPFGGFKLSGVGAKAGGPDYLLQFVEPRTITEDTLRRGFAPDERTAMDLAD